MEGSVYSDDISEDYREDYNSEYREDYRPQRQEPRRRRPRVRDQVRNTIAPKPVENDKGIDSKINLCLQSERTWLSWFGRVMNVYAASHLVMLYFPGASVTKIIGVCLEITVIMFLILIFVMLVNRGRGFVDERPAQYWDTALALTLTLVFLAINLYEQFLEVNYIPSVQVEIIVRNSTTV